jgi:hypothetical protein
MLTQEKRKLDDLNVERLIKKTLVPVNLLTQEEENLKKIIKDFGIEVSGRKLPYHLKIEQICASVSAFQRYKRDQRELLDFSILKSKDYLDK